MLIMSQLYGSIINVIVGAFDPLIKGNTIVIFNNNNSATDPVLGPEKPAVSVAAVDTATANGYFEITIDSGVQQSLRIGIANQDEILLGSNLNSPMGDYGRSIVWTGGGGGNDVIREGNILQNNIGSWDIGDVVGVNVSDQEISFYKNGVQVGGEYSIIGFGICRGGLSLGVNITEVTLNVGQTSFVTSLNSGVPSWDGSQVAVIFTGLDSNFTHNETSLTNTALTLTSISATLGWRSSYSIIGYNSGLHYYEVTRDVAFSNIGSSTTRDVNNRPGGNSSNVGLEIHSGNVYKNNSIIGTVPTVGIGEVVGILINSNSNNIRFIVSSGIFSKAYTINSGTNYTGISVLGGSSSAATVNFGRTAFTHTIFPELTSWDAQTTPSTEVVFNFANISADLEVADLQLTLQKNSVSNSWRSGYSNTGRSTGKHYFEVSILNYNRLFTGVSTTRDHNTFVGTGSNSSGYNSQSGALNTNGSFVTVIATTNIGSFVGVLYDGDTGNVSYTFDGISFSALQSVAAGTYYPGLSIYNDGSQSSARLNFGATAFAFTIPPGYSSWDGNQ